MKAIVHHEFGPPSVLKREDVPEPVPGPGEVIIRVEAVSVNRTLDLAVRAGAYAYKPQLPHILGADPAGTISAVGEGVVDRKVGDRVVSRLLQEVNAQGRRLLLGVHVWGGYAEYVKVAAAATNIVPSGLDVITAASAARQGALALAQLRDGARVKEGDWVLVMGAAGALGSAAVQIAKHLGARVIAAAGSDDRVAAARALGADFGVNYRKQDLMAEVLRITGPGGVSVVLENIGDPSLFPQAFATLGMRGRLVTAGGHGGGIVPLDVKHLYLNQIQIVGKPNDTTADVEDALAIAQEGKFSAIVDRVLPLWEAARAHELVEGRAALGKLILVP